MSELVISHAGAGSFHGGEPGCPRSCAGQVLLDTDLLLRRVRLPAVRAIGCGHNRIEAGWAITSVRPKSAPLNNSGARMTADTA